MNPDRHIGGNHFPKTSRIARLTTLATLYAENNQKRVQYGGPRKKSLSSVTTVTAISMDLMSPLGRAIRTICSPTIKVDGTVMPRAAFLSTLLVRLCHTLVEGLLWFEMSSSSTSDSIFPDFPKRFFWFLKTRDCKNHSIIGLGIANVVCFISVWYERLGCICTVVVKFFVSKILFYCPNNCFDENFVCLIFIFLIKKLYSQDNPSISCKKI